MDVQLRCLLVNSVLKILTALREAIDFVVFVLDILTVLLCN